MGQLWRRLTETLHSTVTTLNEVRDLILVIVAIIAGYAELQSAIGNVVKRQGNIANKVNEFIESNTAVTREPAASAKYYVQLATYKKADCHVAEAEISGYKGAFDPAATLWSDPSGHYVVVAIEAASRDVSDKLVREAHALASDPAQAGNDLAHALLRVNPGWNPTHC